MTEEVFPNLFRIEIPLPDSPLKSLNSYVIRDVDRNLIIDTGLNRDECHEAMQKNLDELGVDLKKTDFFITHLHADHLGLVSRLLTDGNKMYFNRPDAELIEAWTGWDWIVEYAKKSGFPEDELRAALDNHPGFKFSADWMPEPCILKDGETVNIGDYRFKCIETPGHTKGHTCLYEPTKKIFISGDHILNDITPNIQCWSDEENSLDLYLSSLDKVYDLEVDLVLPGHRRLFKNYKGRIDELREHHQKRLDEILLILSKRSETPFQVASGMTWDIKYDSWKEFPVSQKWFATGEAIAHLRYLEEKEMIFRETENEMIVFSAS
ncbi:MAG TPA: MBL fold metallo-hydrolase [Desulfobacterales bacterium]|nr:MBL fold metallo-hydrolase [Desulfobacterales bacterium]